MKFAPVLLLALLVTLPAHGRTIDRTVALVNSDVILQSDLEEFRQNLSLRREIDPFMGLTNFAGDSTKSIMEYLVQEALALQKHAPSEEEIEQEINAVQKNNKIDRDRLREVLKGQGVNFDIYRKLMGVSVAKRKLIDRELRPLAAISDEDVKNFYYTDPVNRDKRKEQRLVLTYRLQQLILPNQGIAEGAARRLRNGDDFDTVAADLAAQGAESSKLPPLSEENMNPRIREAVQGLRVGESTKPVVAGSAYMILRVQEVGAPKDSVFEGEKERIRGQLFQKSLLNQLKLWTERERAAAYINLT